VERGVAVGGVRRKRGQFVPSTPAVVRGQGRDDLFPLAARWTRRASPGQSIATLYAGAKRDALPGEVDVRHGQRGRAQAGSSCRCSTGNTAGWRGPTPRMFHGKPLTFDGRPDHATPGASATWNLCRGLAHRCGASVPHDMGLTPRRTDGTRDLAGGRPSFRPRSGERLAPRSVSGLRPRIPAEPSSSRQVRPNPSRRPTAADPSAIACVISGQSRSGSLDGRDPLGGEFTIAQRSPRRKRGTAVLACR
jgi:hypothetical protein